MNLDERIESILAPIHTFQLGTTNSSRFQADCDDVKQLIRDVLDAYEGTIIDTAVGETSSSFDDQIRYTITNEAMYEARKGLGL